MNEYQTEVMRRFVERLRDIDLRFDVALLKRRMERGLRDAGYQRKEARRIVSIAMDAAINPKE